MTEKVVKVEVDGPPVIDVSITSGNVILKPGDSHHVKAVLSGRSGDVFVGLAPGRTVTASVKTLSGDFRNKVKRTTGERTGTMSLNISSFSGHVTLTSTK